MSSGKAAAMASHASRLSLLKFIKDYPAMAEEFLNKGACGSLVVLKAKKESDVIKTLEKAKEENFYCSEFIDSGHIHGEDFDGSPVLTGIAIGPHTKESMKHLTKKFQVWK